MNLINLIKEKIKRKVGSIYLDDITRNEYNNQTYITFNERPVEYSFVFKHLALQCPQMILDVGSGITSLPHLMQICGFKVTAIDNIKNYWPKGMQNRHFYIINDDIANSILAEKFDFITCISTLEHITKYDDAVDHMFRLLKNGGKLVLTFPYNEKQYCKNVYMLEDSTAPKNLPFATQAFSRQQLTNWCQKNNAKILEQEYWRYFSGDYWTTGERLKPPVKTDVNEKHQITCLLISKQ